MNYFVRLFPLPLERGVRACRGPDDAIRPRAKEPAASTRRACVTHCRTGVLVTGVPVPQQRPGLDAGLARRVGRAGGEGAEGTDGTGRGGRGSRCGKVWRFIRRAPGGGPSFKRRRV